jgi:olefin beta-lactone synthetase
VKLALLDRHARERPRQPAIVEPHRSVTFAELARDARRAADALHRDGLRRGDVVLLLAPMGIPLYTTLVGLFHLGLVAMFVDPSYGRAHLERCCDLVRPKALVGTRRARWLSWACRSMRRIPIRRGLVAAAKDSAGVCLDDSEAMRGSLEEPALVTFTSGNTGEPKAAVRTEGFLLAQHRAVAAALELVPGDVDLTTLPMFVLANLASGVTSVVPDADLRRPGDVDAEAIVNQIARLRPNRAVASPTLLDRLSRHCLARGRRLDSLERVFTGGGPVTPPRMDRLGAAAPCARLAAVYGSTEAEPIAVLDWSTVTAGDRAGMGQGRGLLAGRAVPDIDVAILPERWRPDAPIAEEEFRLAQRPREAAGEIVVSGAHVLGGYLDGRGDAETKIAVGSARWHRTGDSGYVDAAGRLWLLGRSSAVLEDARGRLYPFAVEAAAEACAGVERAALVGVDGRRILAVEAPCDSLPAVRRAVADAVRFADVDDIRILDRIPVDSRHNAKVDYRRLRELAPSPAA